jgi:hypothetical protein
MGFLDTVTGGAVEVGERIIDVPADAVNATTGTGENLGWFGTIDKKLDPRSVDDDEWAEPSEANDGLSGFFKAGTGATTALGAKTGEVTTKPILAFLGFGGGSQRRRSRRQQVDEIGFGGSGSQSGFPVEKIGLVAVVGLGALTALTWGGT